MTVTDSRLERDPIDETLTRRALKVVLDKTTDLAEDVLRVPLNYYNDAKLTEIEESKIRAAPGTSATTWASFTGSTPT